MFWATDDVCKIEYSFQPCAVFIGGIKRYILKWQQKIKPNYHSTCSFLLSGSANKQMAFAERPVGLYWISTTTKFNKISTKYRTQHFIAQNIDQQNFFKMSIIAALHISRPKHACSIAHFGKTV